MRKLAFFGVLLAMVLGAGAAWATDWDSTQVQIPNCQNPSATPFALPGDSVEGVYGIVTARDTIQTAYGFWIELNQFPAGTIPWTGIEVFTGSNPNPVNYGCSGPPPCGVAFADSVVLYGKLTEFGGVGTEIIAKDGTGFGSNLIVRKISSGNNIPDFHDGTLHDFSELNSAVEQWEGMLVRHNGTMRVARKTAIGGFTPGSNCIVVDSVLCPPSQQSPCDSLFIDTASLAGTATPDVGSFIKFVQGPVRQTARGYRILARSGSDIGDIQPPSVTDAYSVSNDSMRVQFDRPVSPTNTGGGALNPAHYTFPDLTGTAVGGVMDGTQAVIMKVTTSLTPGQQQHVQVNGVSNTANPPLTMSTPADRYFTQGIVTIMQIQGPQPDSLALVPCKDVANFLAPQLSPGVPWPNAQRVTYQGVCTGILPGGTPIYFIQDPTGTPSPPSTMPGVYARSGVAVFAPPTALIRGNKYEMVSTIQEFGAGAPNATVTEMTGVSYMRNFGPVVPPTPTAETIQSLQDTTCDVAQNKDTFEDWEGVLMQITNAKITNHQNGTADYTQNFRVAGPYPDVTYDILVDNDAGTDKFAHTSWFPAFGHIVTVTGVAHMSFGEPRLEPRDSTDIVETGAQAVNPNIPARVTFSVYPNPARTQRVSFGLPRSSQVEVSVFDVLGRKIRTLARGHFEAGTYNNIIWDGNDASGSPTHAGLYFYRLQVNGETYRSSGVRLR